MEQPLDHHVQQHQHAHHQQQHLSHKNYVVPFFPSEASSHPRQHQPMVDFGAQSNNASMNISNSNNNNNMSQPSQMQSQNVQYALDMFMNMQGIELPSPSGNAPGMSVSPPNGSNILAHSSISNGAPSDAYSPQLMLEQIRLSQLQHLQQLQQQIFQQQVLHSFVIFVLFLSFFIFHLALLGSPRHRGDAALIWGIVIQC